MTDFSVLAPTSSAIAPSTPSANDNSCQQSAHDLWQRFYHHTAITDDMHRLLAAVMPDWQRQKLQLQHAWQTLWVKLSQGETPDEKSLTDWLITLFNALFDNTVATPVATVLVRGAGEPEYFAASENAPARIEFAHGFFQSALHEISHWCVAGKARREQNDFGYWYEADGRNEATQRLFEQVEIKPQAIECLLSLACGRFFYVSQDNLNADFDTTNSTFAADVFAKASEFLYAPESLPRDAKRLLWVLLALCQPTLYNDA